MSGRDSSLGLLDARRAREASRLKCLFTLFRNWICFRGRVSQNYQRLGPYEAFLAYVKHCVHLWRDSWPLWC